MSEQDLRKVRLEKLENFESPYPHSFPRTHNLKQAVELPEETQNVYLAGRMMTYRDMGKLAFAHLRDHTGTMQIALQIDVLGKESFDFFHRNFDLGDIVGVKGKIFKTHKGEITLLVENYQLLCKALLPMPEKWHGIQDKEQRYRKRYLDLMFNQETVETFKKRTRIIKLIRQFLDNKGALEVENATLETIYGGAAARPFLTHLNFLDLQMYLRISLELPLKKLLVGGFDFVYEIGKVFRNESVDRSHNPEFTLMEWYKAYANYEDTMAITEELFQFLANELFSSSKIKYQGKELDFSAPWKKIKMTDCIKENTGIDVEQLTDQEISEKMTELGIELDPSHNSRGWMINELFEATCEDKLIQPTFITHHPVETTPFCKVDKNDPTKLERFELYMNGWEIANCYSELNDALLQRKYLEEQALNLKKGDTEANPMNEDYVEALEYGLPPNSGIGFGLDRVIMLLTDSESIRDVIFSPLMKPENQLSITNNPLPVKDNNKKIETGITLEDAKKMVKETCDFSLQRHCFMVSASMKALGKYFKDEANLEAWEIAGLLHDIDWNKTINCPENHCGEETVKMLKENKVTDELIEIIRSHYDKTGILRSDLIKKALAAADELSGFIVAVALVRPNKMNDIEAKSIVKKIKDKAFAAQVNREDMKFCEEYFKITVSDFISIILPEMKKISGEWELM